MSRSLRSGRGRYDLHHVEAHEICAVEAAYYLKGPGPMTGRPPRASPSRARRPYQSPLESDAGAEWNQDDRDAHFLECPLLRKSGEHGKTPNQNLAELMW